MVGAESLEEGPSQSQVKAGWDSSLTSSEHQETSSAVPKPEVVPAGIARAVLVGGRTSREIVTGNRGGLSGEKRVSEGTTFLGQCNLGVENRGPTGR